MNKVNIIAMYLPQFYETEENNKWWGKGFTDWISAKNAKPLFEKHFQPHVPLNNNYYNMLDKQTMENQQKMMTEYGIYGMCFYHYWFKDGKKILEKPAENLLKWKDIDMPFCFSWANESWARSWSNIDEKNVWTSLNESKAEIQSNPSGILLEQDYGNKKEWIEHFTYLNHFFQDERYIKIDNKPIFLIYKPSLLNVFSEMKQVWNQLAYENGFDGIYYIACNNIENREYDKILLHEPQYTLQESACTPYGVKKNVRAYYKYENIWKKIVARQIKKNNIWYGGFVGYDDTPRRGKGGTVIDKASPKIFEKYLKMLIKKNEIKGNKLVFINAWNEWGEGMHLEPDEANKYEYLNAVKHAINEYSEIEGFEENDVKEFDDSYKVQRYEGYWKTLHQWMILKEKKIELADFLINQDYHRIAIYGMGMLGKHLLEDLCDTNIKLICGIDKNADSITLPIPVVTPDKVIYEKVDLIIVTVIHDYENIKNELTGYTTKKISSLLDLLKDAEQYKD